MMKLDPSEEDSDDSGNGGRESPVGEGQMVDLEVANFTRVLKLDLKKLI